MLVNQENGRPDWIMVPAPDFIELAGLLKVSGNVLGAAVKRLKADEGEGLGIVANALCDHFDMTGDGDVIDNLVVAMRVIGKLTKHPGIEQRLNKQTIGAIHKMSPPPSQSPTVPAVVSEG